MATSRTGTAQWKYIRRQAIRRAIANGQEHCPRCRALLDLAGVGLGAPVEVDHVIPHALGGADQIDNTEVMCQTCNRRKGKGAHRAPRPLQRAEPDTAVPW